jgi:hypothetical protein
MSCRVDNGLSYKLEVLKYQNSIKIAATFRPLSRIESFNSRLRGELLNRELSSLLPVVEQGLRGFWVCISK